MKFKVLFSRHANGLKIRGIMTDAKPGLTLGQMQVYWRLVIKDYLSAVRIGRSWFIGEGLKIEDFTQGHTEQVATRYWLHEFETEEPVLDAQFERNASDGKAPRLWLTVKQQHEENLAEFYRTLIDNLPEQVS